MRNVWVALASEDIGDQHRRTSLGPIWLMINYLIYIATFAIIFGQSAPIPNFIAYIATGMLIFLFIQEVTTQSVTLYSREESFVAGTTLPMSVYIFRLLMQSAIRSAYALFGCFAVVILMGTPITLSWLWCVLAVAIILLAAPAAIIVFATIGAYFPDSQFIVSNLIRVSLFFTPIFWARSEGIRGIVYLWNPITHFIEIFREPIVKGVLPLQSLGVCIAIVVVLWMLAIFLLGMSRKEIVYLL